MPLVKCSLEFQPGFPSRRCDSTGGRPLLHHCQRCYKASDWSAVDPGFTPELGTILQAKWEPAHIKTKRGKYEIGMNSKQKAALDLALSGHSFLLLGAAGTGKSFVVKEMFNLLRKQGKCVQITCTTGIACSVYRHLPVCTIHKWSGIEDGRYPIEDIRKILTSNVKYNQVVEQIRNTDTLIVDECSMMSKRTFELLEEVCSIRNQDCTFGGIQVIFCGDFLQLPPVPNILFSDDGKFCFESSLFAKVFPHRVVLSDVLRQRDTQLISAICEVSEGNLSETTLDFVKALNRPLDRTEPLKLFATNDLVNDFNRKNILSFPGQLYESISVDSGEQKYLDKMLASKKLWLKVGCPVILLRNLSDVLVNGLRGTVEAITETGPVVKFPTIGVTTQLEKVSFSVFNPRTNRNVAERKQYPVKLAFALTIHKAQGLTLDSVEVDCQQIFRAGQLGVAMSRVKTTDGLRVINFHPRAAISQPDLVKAFMQQESLPVFEDKSCCQDVKRFAKDDSIVTVEEMLCMDADMDQDTDSVEHDVSDTEFDQDFNAVIAGLEDEEVPVQIPETYDIQAVLDDLKEEPVLTPTQANINSILSRINTEKVKLFCQKEFFALSQIIAKMNINEPVPVKTKDLVSFYQEIHKRSSSAEYRMMCLLLFGDEAKFEDDHMHICFNISVSVRKHLLQEKVNLLSYRNRNVTNRQVTNASKARIRYVGGYCVAKVKHEYMKLKNNNMYATSSDGQAKYVEASIAVQTLNNLREEEMFLVSHSDNTDSLLDITRRQNTNRSLTHISDRLYLFFVSLCEMCLSLLTDENMNKYGEEMYSCCLQEIMKSACLHEDFVKVVSESQLTEEMPSSCLGEHVDMAVHNVLERLVTLTTLVNAIYDAIVKKFLLVMFSQFRKDVLAALKVEKTMAHRKQIRAKKTKLDGQSSRKESASSSSTIQVDTQVQGATAAEGGDGDENVTCLVCGAVDGDTEWIECETCKHWLHRVCAGIRNQRKWNQMQSGKCAFSCKTCVAKK